MEILRSYVHPALDLSDDSTLYERVTARAIIQNEDDLLMIYTKRYDDYGFPGGGVDLGEDIRDALLREIQEETGALNVQILSEFGIYEELLPTHHEGYDATHMVSHFYICSADKKLGESNPEAYEVVNGSVPVWVSLDEAILHNQNLIASKDDAMGLTIERETYVLKTLKERLK
ncbi:MULTISPECIES: NUDIX hydrolase [unclassified Fusibacter]|uniref:NUDIX hydrolase n=1 Tax=unclassified Fusibacter TaxID=2624464 RepID=UPI0013E93D88|nr:MULTISPECIES: NUDIX domain-containing protein [unclassified Fusibacter]MCK8060929.1 NUDIX domain-containing protein [Fusibacter sp. A2]NPE23225.1 NUDIX domain-containing protein [Fusibacter sp. A1]